MKENPGPFNYAPHLTHGRGGSSDNPKNLAASARVKLSLLPAAGVIHGAHACMHGAERYGPYNWREKKIALMEYASAAERHIKAWIDGEDYSSDDDVHHFGHAIASLAIALDAMASGLCIDDRPRRGPAPDLMLQVREKEMRRGEGVKEAEPEWPPAGDPPGPIPASPHFDGQRIDPRKVNMRRT